MVWTIPRPTIGVVGMMKWPVFRSDLLLYIFDPSVPLTMLFEWCYLQLLHVYWIILPIEVRLLLFLLLALVS